MASSRELSPAMESNSASPGQLTPTSKVKALLATFDKDSDSESNSGSARRRITAALASTSPSKPKKSVDRTEPLGTTNRSPAKRENNITDDDDEEDIVRPKGRLAARMQANDAASSDEDTPHTGDARERVRRMLLAKSKMSETTEDTDAPNTSGDSNAPVVSRKRKIRTSRRDTPKSSPAKDPTSPGLFVSPSKSKHADSGDNTSDSDALPANPPNDDRFKALVQKKREERQAREAEAAKEKAKKLAERKRHAKILEDDEDELSDVSVGRRLTQPTRKAGKKAQEEIRRETQRLSRNQQLAHNATTKKKYLKADLFAKFNFRQDTKAAEPTEAVSSSSPARHHSDVEMKDTPPTSPASDAEQSQKLGGNLELPGTGNELQNMDDDEDLPTLEDALSNVPSSPPTRLDKGKGRAVAQATPELQMPRKKSPFTQRPIRIRHSKISDKNNLAADDSDSDLEIVSEKTFSPKTKNLDSIFDRIPARKARESQSIHALRMLAQLTSPGKQSFKKNKRPSMTTGELQMSLQQRAKQQAKFEREERLQALRDKGVIVQTAEERQMEMAEVEDLISKARREADEITKREKAAAKKERRERGEEDPLGDSSDDEDWEEGKGGDQELSVSGSEEEDIIDEEEEEDEEGDDEMDDQETTAVNPMFDNEAAEDEEEAEANLSIDEELADDADVDEEDLDHLPANQQQRRNRKAVISDEEDEDEEDNEKSHPSPWAESPMQLRTDSPRAPNSVLRSATKTFIPGVTVDGPAGLGLTQIFAGTMDDSQFDAEEGISPSARPTLGSPQVHNGQGSMAFLKRFPAPQLPLFVPTMSEDTQDQDVVLDSQSVDGESQQTESVSQAIELKFSQSQIHGFDSLVQDSQLSQFPEATQDVGFQHMTPVKGRFVDAPPSTTDTVMLAPTAMPENMEETPIVRKKGRLRQRAQVATFSDEEDNGELLENLLEEDEFEINASAFDVMRKATKAKTVVDDFDKKKSKAKDMVNEQAEESEDEYAGLGGASDDESGEEDAFVKEMIDDEGGKDVDESKLAAFFADRERANDEKQVEKLYKDITNGMLRRKRGADYDLSDSDDGGEARRRKKRAEFAKMRKALLADERIGKIAENPKRQAFLRAIEDRGSEDEMDFLEDFAEPEEGTDSQSQSQGENPEQIVQDSQPTAMAPPKRKLSNDADAEQRPPPHLRRTKPGKKPANLSEIRESLSSLIDEPNAMIAPAESESDSENELEIEGQPDSRKEKENRDPFALRRTKVPVIDRISLKRASSSSISSNARMAFAVSSAGPGFKVPALLRRATTNSSVTSSTSSTLTGGMSATERMAGPASSDGVKRGGGKNSGVHYFARESERRAAVVKTEKRRELKLVKGAQGRRKVVGGLFGAGKFE
ncbi:Uncharacterized protein BP5553_05046 [Venustampulla echinocandica]|uniref:DNA replication checkpoint mediator MRC1 domain-containing protein n=1 Tax=Venustampulla echinocandica TaxID=2656787 RepID=A0A370TQ19_9HELO|nr:Uncharacterized protein BP5553_05046 [Venustampulla echinocandica]RDL37613.1 Uncharacterized protein BP5553_05046 [Venustampulla echinocandica]